MPTFRQVIIVFLTALTLVSCRRDPIAAKNHYLESGNKYFDRGRFTEAGIQYQNAVKIDPKFGPAHYKLGLVSMKVTPPSAARAVKEFRRAVELLKDNQAYRDEYKAAMIRLSELYIALGYGDKQLMADAAGYCDQLFKMDPNSFDAARLTGDLNLARAKVAGEGATGSAAAVEKSLVDAMEYYRKAEALKPNDPAIANQIGQVLWHQKHYAEAEPYFRKVIDHDKTAFTAYLNLYGLFMAEGKTPQAEQVLKEGAQINPKNSAFLERLAFHYATQGRHDEMIDTLRQIKTHAKDWDGVYRFVGDFYLRSNDTESALREYREAIVQDPKHKATYQHSIVEALMHQGKRAEAAEMNSQILKENPKDNDAKSLAATFVLDRGDVARAIMGLQAVLTSDPNNAVAHYELGRALVESGTADSRESARQHFDKAIQLRPDMIQPRLELASLQVTNGQYQAALDSAGEVLKRDPGNVNARLIESQALLGQKKFGESDTLLSAMLKSNPGSSEVYYQAGAAALSQGKLKEAEAAFMRSYELNPANPRALLGVVQTDIQAGQPDKAMTVLQNDSRKAPNRMDIQILMGITARQEGKYADSLAYFNRVLNGLDKKSKTRADIYLQIADTYRVQGDRDNAIANTIKAREILPENEILLQGLGILLNGAGRKSEARQAYEACLKVNPNNIAVLNNLAFLIAETNADLDMALNYAQRAKSLDPNQPDITDTYGWVLLKKGLADQAILVFKDLVNRMPADSTYHYHLAMAYDKKGDSKGASDQLREAMKHNPSKDELQRIREMLGKLGS